MIGKIVKYDTNNGKGTILLKNGTLKDFSIEEWKDFDILPEYGLKVEIKDNNIIPLKEVSGNKQNVESKNQKNNEDMKKKKTFKERIAPFVQEQIKRGWKLEFEGEDSFTMVKDEDVIKAGKLIGFIIIGIIVASIFSLLHPGLGIIAFIVFFVIAFKAASQTERHTLTGKLIPEEDKIFATIDNKPAGYLTVNGDLYMPPKIPKTVFGKILDKIT